MAVSAELVRENAKGSSAPRLGERLVRSGAITEQQLRQALEVQGRSRGFIGQILVDLGFIRADVVGRVLARDFGLQYVNLERETQDPEAVRLVPEHLIRTAQAIPFRRVDDTLHVAMVDPLNVGVIDAIHQQTGLRVTPYLSMASEVMRAANEHFDAQTRTSEVLQEMSVETLDAAPSARAQLVAASEAPVVRLVNSLIESALAARASDIHFEPYESGLRVRFRVDGTLLEQADIPHSQQAAVLARLKVLCLMDITENRRPQDGRMSFNEHGRVFDIRVSSVPAVFGEKIVLRILDKSSVLVPLQRLGFLPEQQHDFEALIHRPHGIVIVVGPTGSGKSTTLYASLNILNDATLNIMTLEDPVEYNIQGINQVQVNQRIGLTFAHGLRAFVRQDPDIILVGEIRDGETAEMAVQASLTGHLVLSTLHTNSAVGTVARLANLGTNSFLVAQSLAGVVSQRLVAKICSNCSTDYEPGEAVLESVGITPREAREIQFKRGAGCRNCHGTGYMGRQGVFEVMVIGDELAHLIMSSAPEDELHRAAVRSGMITLRDCALRTVQAGLTTPGEMGRVVLAKGG